MGTSLNLNNVVCYGIGSYHSNAWTSGNPDSGIYEADVAKEPGQHKLRVSRVPAGGDDRH